MKVQIREPVGFECGESEGLMQKMFGRHMEPAPQKHICMHGACQGDGICHCQKPVPLSKPVEQPASFWYIELMKTMEP